MIGPTGVGKTEIARRLAKLAGAPFVKVEASKFTEVGYVGRDVDSMIRDLAETSVTLVKAEATVRVQEKAREVAEERLLDLLLPRLLQISSSGGASASPRLHSRPRAPGSETREKFREMLRNGKLEDRPVEIDVRERSGGTLQVFTNAGSKRWG